jgi:hypothetical protein
MNLLAAPYWLPMHNLCICGREATGFAYDPRLAGVGTDPPMGACCLAHLNIISANKGRQPVATQLTDNENQAVMNASPAIGEYLESTGVTDMAQMSYEQWLDFLAFAFAATCDERAKLWADGVPV